MTSAPVSTAEPEELAEPLPPVKGGTKRLLAWSIPANFSIFLIWGSVAFLLLPLQVQGFGEADKVANLAIITTIGALAAMLAQPIAGAISDRTRSRFGRRAPWMVGGVLVGGLALVSMGFASSLVHITIAWVFVQIAYNFAQGPLSAILPDRIPRAARGTFSALVGIATMLGAVGGSAVGSAFAANIGAGYFVVAGVALIAIVLFVVFNPDHSSTELPRERFDLAAFLRAFWVSPAKHPDFFWAFTGRLLLYIGYFAVTGYQLYILQDYIGLEQADATALAPLVSGVSLLGIVGAAAISGPLSDKLGRRRKVFVFISSAVVGASMLVPIFMPTVPGWFIFAFLSGLGFGCFSAVDQALMSEVLPSAKSFGKDLGVVNIAAALPQVLAPAIAGAIILTFGGYLALFPIGIVLSVLGAFAVWPIKAVR
jgi:MFS family permease